MEALLCLLLYSLPSKGSPLPSPTSTTFKELRPGCIKEAYQGPSLGQQQAYVLFPKRKLPPTIMDGPEVTSFCDVPLSSCDVGQVQYWPPPPASLTSVIDLSSGMVFDGFLVFS